MRYPLGQYEREFIQSKTGKKLEEITLDEVLKGHISSDDIKISKETLKAQGQVAAENGNFWAVHSDAPHCQGFRQLSGIV